MTRKATSRLLGIVLACLLCPALAWGQRLPREGGFSIWGNAGATLPDSSLISSTFGVSAGLDYFATRSLSFGAALGGWKASTNLDFDESLAYFDLLGTYNWEKGKFHPFAQGGVGLYRINPPAGSTATKLGGFLGGGLDYFLAGNWAVEGVARYHFVPEVGDLNGRFLELLAGVKFYF